MQSFAGEKFILIFFLGPIWRDIMAEKPKAGWNGSRFFEI